MTWTPLFIALGIWAFVVFIADRAANQRALEARYIMDEANALSRKYLEHMKENSKLLEELNALLRLQQ